MEFGFSASEARLGLRTHSHQVGPAVEYLLQVRERKEEMEQRERTQRSRKKRQRELGKTADGSW